MMKKCCRVLKVIGFAAFMFFIVGGMSTVLGTFISITIGILMLAYIFEE